MQTDENIVKSIIYGSPVQTSYGLFRSLCSAINHKDHIDKIIFYLRNNHNFQKYNKFVYAFRLQQSPNDLFITEEQIPEHEKFLEGYNDDTGLEGNGEKLLNLLKKFNVRNVLVIVAIRQKDPLKQFNSEHYVQVVKCAKDLLSSLYDKVVLSKTSYPKQSDEVVFEPIQQKQFHIPLQTYYKKVKQPANPNYVGQQYLKKSVSQKFKKLKSEMNYLNQKIEELANTLEDIIEDFAEIEDSQIEFAIRYDKTPIVMKVFHMLSELFGLQSKQDFAIELRQQQGPSRISNYLRSITMKSLTSETIRKLNQQLLSDQSLKHQNIAKQNRICGLLMQFIQVLLKSYSFARRLAIIQSQIQEQQGQFKRQDESDDKLKI